MKNIKGSWFLIAAEVIIAVLLIFLIGFVVFGLLLATNPETSKAARILDILNNDWKVLLILVLVPFYHPIYVFLRNLREVRLPGGTKLKTGEPPEKPPTSPSPMKPPHPNGGLQ